MARPPRHPPQNPPPPDRGDFKEALSSSVAAQLLIDQEISSIFALRFTDELGEIRHALTIEVYRPERKIVQIRSKWNDDPCDKDLKVLSQWAIQNKLTG